MKPPVSADLDDPTELMVGSQRLIALSQKTREDIRDQRVAARAVMKETQALIDSSEKEGGASFLLDPRT